MNIIDKLQKMAWIFIFTVLLAGLNPVLAPAAPAATLTVNTLLDNDTNGDGLCTLREAITAAENNASYHECTGTSFGLDKIILNLSGTIALGSALPEITDSAGLTINGVKKNVTISGEDTVRIFDVSNADAELTLEFLNIANGKAVLSSKSGNGGGVYSNGSLTVNNCTFSSNHAEGNGGAIYKLSDELIIKESIFSYNSADSDGGALFAYEMAITGSTFSSNHAENGGAIRHAYQTATITNCTFSGNSASNNGGCIYNITGFPVYVTNSTFSGNWAADGGCFYATNSSYYLKNTIVANSTTGENCGGTIIYNMSNSGNNIEDGTTCGWGTNNGSKSSTPPLLGALGNYGGPTQTFRLLAGSPAIEGVTYNAPNDCPATDQRGVSRPIDGNGDGTWLCDVGAYEKEIEIYLPMVRKD